MKKIKTLTSKFIITFAIVSVLSTYSLSTYDNCDIHNIMTCSNVVLPIIGEIENNE